MGPSASVAWNSTPSRRRSDEDNILKFISAQVALLNPYLVDMGTTGYGMAGRLFKERFVDALCWYFEAMGLPLSLELEDDLELLILEGLLDSEPAALIGEVAEYTLLGLDQ